MNILETLSELNAHFVPPGMPRDCSSSIFINTNDRVGLGLWINGQVEWFELEHPDELNNVPQIIADVSAMMETRVVEPQPNHLCNSEKLHMLADALSDHLLGGESGWESMEFEDFVALCTAQISLNRK